MSDTKPGVPAITDQPADISVAVGQTAAFNVTASGTSPLAYQWKKNGTNIGTNSSSYTTPVTALSDNGNKFSVVVTNTAGNVTSTEATLTVTAVPVAPTITTQPANKSVTVGQTATFNVTASGTSPFTYQWRKGTTNIGTNSSSYTTPVTALADTNSKFSVVVSNSTGNITSAEATLTVTALPAGCQHGAALSDGCPGAPAGTPQLPHLLDVKQVTALSILPGSGYTNGTYTWTASGGGGSGATGTVTVAGGVLGGLYGLQYTISNGGTGYTGRPTIAVPAGAGSGSGGSIVPTVYQATPHNAATPWNMPGVDYYVGIPTGTVLKDPTVGANLPTGAAYVTYAGSGYVNVTGCNVTLDSFDFTLHNTALVINVSGTNCTTTLQNSKQHALPDTLTSSPAAELANLGSGGTFVYQKNEYDGLAPYGQLHGSGLAVNAPICCSGNVLLQYNYFHNFDAKIIQMSGTVPTSTMIERYNLFSNFGSCGGDCAHGEAEYMYAGTGNINFTGQFNTYVLPFYNSGSSNLTAPHSVLANDTGINGTTDDHNVVLAQGPQSTCATTTHNANYYVAAALIYDGSQNTNVTGTMHNVSFDHNYTDASGVWFTWYHSADTPLTGVTWTNNVDTGTGNACN